MAINRQQVPPRMADCLSNGAMRLLSGPVQPGSTSPNPRHLAVWLCRWLTGGMAEWRERGEIVYIQLCGWLTACDCLSVVYNKNKYTYVTSCSNLLIIFKLCPLYY